MKITGTNLSFFLAVCIFSCNSDLPPDIQLAYEALPEKIDFNIHVKPILSDKCFACHGPDKNKVKAGLQLHQRDLALAELPERPGHHAIRPGRISASEVFHRILSHNPKLIMPPPESNLALSNQEKATLIRWIKEGADYKPHWAFVKPENHPLPKETRKDWPKNGIDYFILDKLEQQGLSPTNPAEKSILLRRLYLDLTGLPPTPEQIQSFLNDESPQAFEKVVDYLLASPHYGEKMATNWMDVARFADTHGYTVDRYRDMSPWRDWVINAFNENQPFDEFITWQLAGDLFETPTKEQLIATGFNRLHQQNMEGGIIDEEFRVEYVADRTQVLGTGLMGLSISCARCHDHKYDPISQKEYYELFSFFNNVNESGQISWGNDTPVPTMLLPTEEQEAILQFIENEIEETSKAFNQALENSSDEFEHWINTQQYQQINRSNIINSSTAYFKLDGHLKDQIRNIGGQMGLTGGKAGAPNFVTGNQGQALKLDGDTWLNLHPAGIFDRSEAFSIGIWLNIPEALNTGVIAHKCEGAKLHNFKGYQLFLRENKLEVMLAHTAPDNALIVHTNDEVPKNEWFHVLFTYDGSSKAEGIRIFINREKTATSILHNNLYKNITYNRPKEREPGLKIGARWRGFGIKGAMVDELIVFDRELSRLEIKLIAGNEQFPPFHKQKTKDLSTENLRDLKAFFQSNISPSILQKREQLSIHRKSYADSLEKVQEMMVMKEMSTPRATYILDRGQYDAPSAQVFPNTPKSILSFPTNLEKNRLGLAKWLTHPDHPLTARVVVNRYWQNYFGRGLVKTSEDFGNQGELPSHPKLLDWLAKKFIESGWDIKALQKLIVLSATYQQSSIATEALLEVDPDNVLIARGPAFRLTSEMLRDNVLTASGLLNPKIGGKSVKPYQPDGLWKISGSKYKPDEGPNLYRRSLYTFWKRTVPHPTQATFDQPDRSECTMRRQVTNTPLQALAIMNDPTFIEASKKIGETIVREGNNESAINQAFMRLTGRAPLAEELSILKNLQVSEYRKMINNKDKTIGWLNTGQYKVDPRFDPIEVAANTVVASTIMNSDACITKR